MYHYISDYQSLFNCEVLTINTRKSNSQVPYEHSIACRLLDDMFKNFSFIFQFIGFEKGIEKLDIEYLLDTIQILLKKSEISIYHLVLKEV